MGWQRLLQAAMGALVLGAAGQVAADAPPTIDWSSLEWSGSTASARSSSGGNVELGLDRGMSQRLSHFLSRSRPIAGAATLVHARTGQVLAAAEVGSSKSGSLLFDPVAPAASVFKVVTTAALYEHSNVTPVTRVCTKGGLRTIERHHLRAPRGGGTVCAPFAHALGVSRNAAYAQLATRELLREDLIETAERFGFNASLRLDATGQVGTLKVPYNDLAFARTAAGFENSSLSVFGGAQLALTIASGGLALPLRFEKVDGSPRKGAPRVIAPSTARRIRNAMEVTIHSGTASSSFVSKSGRSLMGPIQVAGKTGTLRPSPGAPTASWFIGFAPSENPLVVVSVLLQNPPRWHQQGHQLARDLLQDYFSRMGVPGVPEPR